MMNKQELQELMRHPVDFLESKYGYYVPELRKPIKHQKWERRLLNTILTSNKKIRVIGSIKKDLKTTKAAEIAYFIALKYSNSEIYIISNDFEQSKSRVFSYLVRSLELNPYVATRITQNQISFNNGTFIKALPSDYRGEAGSNPRLSVFDEPWGFISESAVRMVEEFTPPPNLPEAFQLYVGYAGFENESKLWLDIYEKGLKGQPIKESDNLPLYETDQYLMYWSHGPLNGHPGQPWHTPEYFRDQKATLRPFQYIRLFHNKWVSGSESFISKEDWHACVDRSYRIPLPDKKIRLCVGVDAGIKNDTAAVEVRT